MQGNSPNQQAYDRGTSIFSPDGRIYQVEYAREAVKQGSPVVGATYEDGVVLAATISTRSPLVKTASVEKLYSVDDHLVVGGSGHAADTRRLVDVARQTAQHERRTYDEPITASALATTIADHIHEQTQAGGSRPYGTALLIGGGGPTPELLEIDPSGSTREWRAKAIGRGSGDILDHLERDHDDVSSPTDALELIIDGLDENEDDFDVTAVTAVNIGRDGYAFYDTDTIETAYSEDA